MNIIWPNITDQLNITSDEDGKNTSEQVNIMSDKVEGEYFTNWACSFRGNIHSVASEKILTILSYFSDVVGVCNASNGDNNSIWIADPVEKADEEPDTLNTYDRKDFTGWNFNLKCVDEELSVEERQRIFRKNIAQLAVESNVSRISVIILVYPRLAKHCYTPYKLRN